VSLSVYGLVSPAMYSSYNPWTDCNYMTGWLSLSKFKICHVWPWPSHFQESFVIDSYNLEKYRPLARSGKSPTSSLKVFHFLWGSGQEPHLIYIVLWAQTAFDRIGRFCTMLTVEPKTQIHRRVTCQIGRNKPHLCTACSRCEPVCTKVLSHWIR